MGQPCDTIRLYSAQADAVLQVLERDGVSFSKAEYVRGKYGESAPIFLTAYSWFVSRMEKIVPRPQGAEFPYWAFGALYSVDRTGTGEALALDVPLDQVVLFDLYDWNKIMQLRYLGEDEQEERLFQRELARCGLRETDVMLTGFHPQWKERILESWERLFRHHDRIRKGDLSGVGGVQAGLWQIRSEWIRR